MNLRDGLNTDGGNFFCQWHITERCNWRCAHCYQETRNVRDLSFDRLKHILEECLDLFRILHTPPRHARINIGGGEPFLRKDFFDFLRLLNRHRDVLTVTVMSNGSLIDAKAAQALADIPVLQGVQVSLEGLERTNDHIRGRGAFAKTINAVHELVKRNIHTAVSFTVHKKNVDELEPLAVYLKKIGVRTLGARRYVPLGQGRQLKEYLLDPGRLREYYLQRNRLMRRLNEPGIFTMRYGCEDGIYSFLAGDDEREMLAAAKRRCAVVDGRGFTIFSNGDVYVCRRFPKVAGNVFRKKLSEIYLFSDTFWTYRNRDHAHPLCKACPVFDCCLGGAKCITDAYFGRPFYPDPQCFRLFKRLPGKRAPADLAQGCADLPLRKHAGIPLKKGA